MSDARTEQGQRELRGFVQIEQYAEMLVSQNPALQDELYGTDDWRTDAIDLIADVLHALDAEDMDANGACAMALAHFRAERREALTGEPPNRLADIR